MARFAKNNLRNAFLSKDEQRKAEDMCSPEFQPQLWEEWRERLNGWSGGHDTYQDIYNISREIDEDTASREHGTTSLVESISPNRLID